MTQEEDLKEAERKKRTLFLLIGGAVLLILPLIVLAITKLAGSSTFSSEKMNGSIFDARTNTIGSKIAPAPAPAPPTASATSSSLGLIIGYKGTAAPQPPLAAKPKPKQAPKTPKKSLSQIKTKKQQTQIQAVSTPKLKPSPFGAAPTQANAPQAPNVGSTPNAGNLIQNIMKGMPQGQSIPPNAQQMIQQATQQGGAPQVPPPAQ